MLLRRVMKHVQDQNWLAVSIDFVIVVIGVFIGIQVANWNDAQNNKAGLVASLERLDKEVSQNIKLIDTVLEHYELGRTDFNDGREALNECISTPDGQAALERVLLQVVEDVHPNFVTIALDQLSMEARHQDLLSTRFQQDFGIYAGRLKEEHEQLTSHYEKMWAYHITYHPSVSAYFPSNNPSVGGGWGFKLDKPFDEVCADASFRTRFINTIGFYASIYSRLIELKSEVELFQASLAEELDKH